MIVRTVRALPVLVAAAGMAGGLAGCASTDYVRAAEKAMERANNQEDPSAFFAPILARVQNDPEPPPIRPQAKQHYLAIIANLEGLTVGAEKDLKQQGLLGEAFVLKTLAQWRLGRVSQARTSALRAKASDQEALDATHRALFVAFDGVVQLDGALDAVAAGRPYAEIFPAIAGPAGAWRRFGDARTEAGRGDPIQIDLMQARLASFKILKEARDNTDSATLPSPDGEWDRLVAEARIEIAELAAFPASNRLEHGRMVARWATSCQLSLPAS